MGTNSTIEWTDHTFNPWIGCTHVSPGCEHCYAETLMDQRYGRVQWGKGKPRQRTSADYWKQPLRWNKQAEREGRRYRVFCSSLADVFDPEVPDAWRLDLFNLIWQTRHLDWLLLTKRPQLIQSLLEKIESPGSRRYNVWRDMWPHEFPNVWLGTSVEDQRRADERIPHLLRIPAAVRFLSCEPLLGPVDLSDWLWFGAADKAPSGDLQWVIGGGESGPEARHCELQWARSLRDQCVAAGVAFFWKQWGEFVPASQAPADTPEPKVGPRSRRAMAEWARVLGEPSPDKVLWRVGKHRAGRLLDGVEWNEVPV